MRSGWSSTQLPKASSHTTPGPASSVSTAQFLISEPLKLAGQQQLQRLAQFVETHPYPAVVLEMDDHVCARPIDADAIRRASSLSFEYLQQSLCYHRTKHRVDRLYFLVDFHQEKRDLFG